MTERVQAMEAINERDSCVLCDLRFDVLSDGRGAKDTEVLTFLLALLVGLDGSHEQVVPG